MRLGEILHQEGLVAPDALEEALELQVVHGGRLGTNLVELGLLTEAQLAKALGRQHNVAFASGNMTPDPKALQLIGPDFADDHDLLPMRVDQTRVSVACTHPHDLAALDRVGFVTGRRVVPVVIPEFRMHQLLRKHCGAFRSIRPIDLGQTRPSRTLAAKEEAKAPVTDLMNEDEFQSLYAKALSGDAAAPGVPPGELPAGPAPSPRAQVVPLASAPPPDEEEVLEGVLVEDAAPATAPPPVAPVAPDPPPPPLSFAQAQAALQQSQDREDVATTVLRFAIGKWKRALILNVQGPLITGWHGMGEGIREKAVRRIGVALRGQSTFKLVCDTRSHFIGPMKRDAGTAVFYKMLGGTYPTTAVMLPLLVRGRVVHVLYVDNGPGQLTPPDVGELLILSQSVGRSYEAMIRRRKTG